MNPAVMKSRQDHWQVRLSRRQLLLSTTVSLATAALPATNRLPVSGHMRHLSIADFHFNEFAAVRGTKFQIYQAGESPRSVELTAVKAATFSSTSTHMPHHESFSLIFCAPKGRSLPQGTYLFAHPQLGYFDLFIVPVQPLPHEERYIAIVNRI